MHDIVIRETNPKKDIEHFKRVYELASHGLAPYLWRQDCPKGESLDDYVNTRIKSRLEKSGMGESLMATVMGRPAGGILTYSIGSVPEEIPELIDPNIAPLIELEIEAPNTRYINVVAVFPELQGRGVGQKLIEAIYPLRGKNGISLIVEDTNPGAQRLYERLGFNVTAKRPFLPVGWESECQEYRLMIKRD